MTRTDNLFYTLDRWVFDLESENVPLQEIIEVLHEYIEILEDLDVA